MFLIQIRADEIGSKLLAKAINRQQKLLLERKKLIQNEPQHGISNNVVYATSKDSDEPAHTRHLIRAFASRLNIL